MAGVAARELGLVLALCVVGVLADLPIHCLNTQIVGEWVFELGDNSHGPGLRCGHKVPDTNADHFTKHGYELEVVKKLKLNISDPNVVIDGAGNHGTWTMVYDEGFEVLINGQSFFAFSKYVPKTPESLEHDNVKDYTSICGETLVGWYHKNDGTKWGCYHGKKIKTKAKKSKPTRFREVASSSSSRSHQRHLQPPADLEQPQDASDSVSTGGDKTEQDALWEPDYAFVEMVNSDESSSWRAKVHRHFVGNRMDQMMRMLGRSNLKRDMHRAVGDHKRRKHPRKTKTSVHPAHLPREFDWRNHNGKSYDSRVKNQGNCGSCFAMASISVAEARIRILSNLEKKPLLSTQAVVSCSMYNQGCEGGYPYLVAKHAMDFGLVPQACLPYTGTDEECTLRHNDDCPRDHDKYMVTNYSYVGGYYGNCNEQDMMDEIYKHGPIMVAFDAPGSLFYYNGGVYTGASPPHEGVHLKYLHPWEKTNHAVVAVGWGETKSGTKYWIIKNTWGAQWGENGYFRIRRGTDECGIESMAVTMQLKLP